MLKIIFASIIEYWPGPTKYLTIKNMHPSDCMPLQVFKMLCYHAVVKPPCPLSNCKQPCAKVSIQISELSDKTLADDA